MYPFNEQVFPCENAAYLASLEAGREQAKKLTVTFLLLARDVSANLRETTRHIKGVGSMFKSWRAHVMENDSKDKTPGMLRNWRSKFPRQVSYECIKVKAKKWGMVREGKRGQDMAKYRNRCRANAHIQPSKTDLVIVLDSDLQGVSCDGIANTLSRWDAWDAVFSSGLRKDKCDWVQADAWALRYGDTEWTPKLFKDVRDLVPARGADWIEVFSAFGGMGLYKVAAYCEAGYGGGDCEHVIFHKRLHAKGHTRMFLNPSQIVVYRW